MNKRAGFTFVEILIALLILAVAAVPLMRLFAASIEQIGVCDDLRTALDLAREEVEKLKNIALTEEQIKQIGTVVNPPVRLNEGLWYTVRRVDPLASPLEVRVFVYRSRPRGTPLVSVSTILNK